MARETTDRRSTEEALRQAQARFRQLAENIEEAFWLISPDETELFYVSPAYETIVGRSCQSLLDDPRSWLEALHPEDRRRIELALEAEPVPYLGERNHECRTVRPDGEVRWVRLRSRPVYDEEGSLVGRAGTAVDITDRKRAEEALRESERRFSSIFEKGGAGMATTAADGRFLQVNDELCRFLGYTERELLKLKVADVTHPDDREETLARLAEVRAGQRQVVELEKRYVRKDGATVWGHITAIWLFGSNQEPLSSVAMVQDITERKRGEEELREREEQLRSVIGGAKDAVIVADGQGTITLWNKASERIFGYREEEAMGKPLTLIMPDRFHKKHQRGLSRTASGGPGKLLGRTVELTGRRKDGSEFPLELSLTRWRTGKGVFFTGIIRDIADRKRAEEELRQSDARFRQLAENIDAAISLAPLTGRGVSYISPAYEKIWGRSCQSLYDDPRSWQEYIHPQDKARVLEAFGKRVELGRYDEEFRIIREDGAVRWVRDRSFPIRDAKGKVQRLAGVTEDITDRKEADAALRENEERFRSAFDHSAVGMMLVDLDGRFQRANDAYCQMLGYTEEELRTKAFVDVTHPDDVEASVANVRRVLAGEIKNFNIEKRYLHKNGDVRWGLTGVSSVRDADGRPLYLVAETQDITERKRAEQALQASEETLRQLAENIREVFWITSADGRDIIYVSPAYEEVWGQTCQSLYEKPDAWTDAIHPDDRQRIRDGFYGNAGESGYDVEYRVVRPDGSIRWIRDRGFPVVDNKGKVHRIVGLAEDITELAEHREHLEALVEERTNEVKSSLARLGVAERLALIGTLTAGLGHDIGNILLPIRLRFDTLEWDKCPANLKDLLLATRHAVDYLQQLSHSLRLLAVDPEDPDASEAATSLPDWWDRVKPLMSNVLPEHVRLETDIPRDLPPADVAPHRLTQAVLNLVANAAEATRDRGCVRIWARPDEDQRVRIGVTDEGVGMTEEVRRQAFDPFFTTKTRGLSTGLGLWLVHGIVSASRGAVTIDSAPGRGTTVALTFPLADAVATGGLHAAPYGRATVSLSDPQKSAWVSDMLRSAGYEVRRPGDVIPEGCLWLTEPTPENLATAQRFASGESGRRLIVLGEAGDDWHRLGAVVVKDKESLEMIRSAVRQVIPEPGAG